MLKVQGASVLCKAEFSALKNHFINGFICWTNSVDSVLSKRMCTVWSDCKFRVSELVPKWQFGPLSQNLADCYYRLIQPISCMGEEREREGKRERRQKREKAKEREGKRERRQEREKARERERERRQCGQCVHERRGTRKELRNGVGRESL